MIIRLARRPFKQKPPVFACTGGFFIQLFGFLCRDGSFKNTDAVAVRLFHLIQRQVGFLNQHLGFDICPGQYADPMLTVTGCSKPGEVRMSLWSFAGQD
jgi:hypothetical protein